MYEIGGWVAIVFLNIPYLLPVLNTLRFFMLCTYTEPGVIPKVRSAKIDYNKTHYVSYRTGQEQDTNDYRLDDFGREFYSLSKFKTANTESFVSGDKEMLSYCNTC